jgi:hypothetical protein
VRELGGYGEAPTAAFVGGADTARAASSSTLLLAREEKAGQKMKQTGRSGAPGGFEGGRRLAGARGMPPGRHHRRTAPRGGQRLCAVGIAASARGRESARVGLGQRSRAGPEGEKRGRERGARERPGRLH